MEFVQMSEAVQDDRATLELFAEAIRPFYEPRLPYHNWDEHVAGSIDTLWAICDEAEAERGIHIDRLKAGIAWLGHDAGYAHDLISPQAWEPYGSKEGYSAHITGGILRSFGMEEDFISDVQSIIVCGTKLDEEPDTNEAIADRMTDLANIAGSYRGFIVNSFKLMEEDKIYGRERSLKEFKEITRFVLTKYLSIDFLPVDEPHEASGSSCFVVDARANIERFMGDTPEQLLRELGSHAKRFARLVSKDRPA
jgi:hypothetical protein